MMTTVFKILHKVKYLSPIITLTIGQEPSGADEFLSPQQDGSENSQQDVNTNTTIDFGVQDFVLPVELLSFKATADKDHIDLTWATASELNNSHFELERSEDGKSFKMIGTYRRTRNSFGASRLHV